MVTFFSQPIIENTIEIIFNMKSSIQHNMLWDLFFFFIFSLKKKELFENTLNFFFVANKNNSKAIPKSSSIKLT
jgi:hypothetical protein